MNAEQSTSDAALSGVRSAIGGVVFDKDGTLFDFRQSWGGWVRRLLAELAVSDDHRRMLARALDFDPDTGAFGPNSPVIAATSNEIASAVLPLLPETSHRALVTRMNLLAIDAEMVPAVPLRPLLCALRARGLRIGLATNDVEAAARMHLSGQNVEDLFDLVAGYDSGHGAKPAPGMLLAFARATGLAPASHRDGGRQRT